MSDSPFKIVGLMALGGGLAFLTTIITERLVPNPTWLTPAGYSAILLVGVVFAAGGFVSTVFGIHQESS